MNINLGSIQVDLMVLMLVVGCLLALGVLFYAQSKNDKFDLRYLILSDNDRPSISKLGQLFSLLVSSWAFVYLVLHDKMTETYYTMYMGIYAATNVASKFLDKKNDQQTPPQS